MMQILYVVGAWLAASMVARVLVSAGMTITYYVVLATVANELINILQAQIGGLPSAPYNLLGLGGIWQGMGYILSAMLARVTMQASMVRLTRAET